MGLFSFVKNAGAKLFGRKDKKKKEAENQAKENEAKADAIKSAIANHGIEIDYLRVIVDDDKVTLSGVALTKAYAEKAVLIAGNVEGIATVDDQLEVSEEVPKPRSVDDVPYENDTRFYTVEKGDSLWKIAAAHYNDGSKYPVIFEANKPMLEHPDKIYPGQMLRIPPLGQA
jgi:nucleoid-associated protein YgaU